MPAISLQMRSGPDRHQRPTRDPPPTLKMSTVKYSYHASLNRSIS